MSKIRVAVVGLGMGRAHAGDYIKNPDAELAALVDLDKERLKESGKEFGVDACFTDFSRMLEKVKPDAVSIAVPNKFHKAITIEALQAGCHVLCEKPMALTVAESEEMAKSAMKSGKNLMINFSYRFSEMSYSLKEQVDAGYLGDIYFGRTIWHRRRGFP